MTTTNKPAPASVVLGGGSGGGTETLEAMVARLQAENAALKVKAKGPTREVKARANPVGKDKDQKVTGGNVSVTGLTAQFPFSFFTSQSLKLFQPSMVATVLQAHLTDIANQRMKGVDAADEARIREESRVELVRLIGIYSTL